MTSNLPVTRKRISLRKQATLCDTTTGSQRDDVWGASAEISQWCVHYSDLSRASDSSCRDGDLLIRNITHILVAFREQALHLGFLCPFRKLVQFYWLQLRITCKSSNRQKLLGRKAKHKSLDQEVGVCEFDWIIAVLCCFVLKLCVRSLAAAQNVIFRLCLICHRTNEFTVVEPIDSP